MEVQLHALLTLVHTAVKNYTNRMSQFTTEDTLRNQALICLTMCNLTENEENIYSVSNSYDIKKSTALLPAIHWPRNMSTLKRSDAIHST